MCHVLMGFRRVSFLEVPELAATQYAHPRTHLKTAHPLEKDLKILKTQVHLSGNESSRCLLAWEVLVHDRCTA